MPPEGRPQGVAPGKVRLLVEAGSQLVMLAENKRWVMSQADRQKRLDEWRLAVEAAREELR